MPNMFGRTTEVFVSRTPASRADIVTVEAHFSAVLINCPSVSTLCHNLKYGGHPRTARHLGYHFLGPAIASAHKDIVLVPMPVSKQRRRRRGYNQSEGLAQGCLRKLTESGYRAARRCCSKNTHTARVKLR